MAAYAALTSLLQILDQLKHHPLTEIATFLQEFLEGYNSPFVDSDEADPLEMRIADAAYAAEDVIEAYIVDNIHFAAAEARVDKVTSSSSFSRDEEINSDEDASSREESSSSGEETNNQKKELYIVDNIHFAAAETHDDEVNSSSVDELNPEEETNSYEDGESSFPGEEEINSYDEVISSGGESSFSGNELNSEEEINSNETTASHDDEVTSSGGELNSEKDIDSNDEDASSGHGEAIKSGEEISCVEFYQDVWKVIEEMDLVKKEAMSKMMREKTDVQAHHQLQRNVLRSSPFTGKNIGTMVGFDDVLFQLLDKLTAGPSSLQVIPITGMGGIGKTTLARNIFQHALVKEHFDICAWVTISQQYNTKEILRQILYQASGESSEKSEEELGDELHKYLFCRRYLIIMDDIWNIEVWEKMRFFFADCNNGSQIVVTTRQSSLTSQLNNSNDAFHMEFLDEDNSWNLFSKTVFGEEGFPPQLEKIGKKIVKKCWEDIEQNFNSIVNLENDDFCLKILKLSYHHLPAYLKPCFLYMGIFKEDTRIHVSTLIKLWVCEGFIKPENGKSLELIGEGFMKDLIDRNLILVDVLGKTGNIKFCKMHDLLRDLCMKEAENERFYHVIGQHSRRGIQNHMQRRMVSDRSTSEERLTGALESTRSHVRALIYRLVFPSQVLIPRTWIGYESGRFQLEDVIVNSHYAAIINFSEKPKFLSLVNFLWNLHILRINVGHVLIVAPVEIWKMSQLRHVEFKCRGNMYLPDPPSGSSIVIMENLQTLTRILNFKCGEEIVKRIPNIRKLQIAYKETGRHDGDDYCLNNLHSLHKLESFSIKVYGKFDYFLHTITFPQSLRKLSLLKSNRYSGVGWEEMLEKIGRSLPLLQTLKLEWGKFTTHKWETVEGQFRSLKFLKLYCCKGLKYWTMESSHFPCLEHLHLSHIEELEEIPLEIGEIPTLQSIELRYCSESAVKSAKKIVEEQEELQGGGRTTTLSCSSCGLESLEKTREPSTKITGEPSKSQLSN